jgi:diguanylate cyclase (GGDEF)-like protein/PAS domain S-box-containing protein
MSAGGGIRILLVEDAAPDAELAVRELKRAGMRVAHRVVDTEADLRRALAEFRPQVILSDFAMPQFDGMEALALARLLAPDVPFIFVSGTLGEDYAIRALKNGATDYVLKTNLVRLPAAVERALHDAEARAERRRTEAELEAARERLSSIFLSVDDVLWSVALPEERLLYVSPAAAKVYGREANEFIEDGRLWLEALHPEDRPALQAAYRAVRRGEPSEIEVRVVRPGGEVRWLNVRARLARDATGQTARIDGISRDVTERVEQRRRQERLARLRDFVSAVNAALVRVRERDTVFEEVCRVAVVVGGLRGARIGLVDRKDGALAWLASWGAIADSGAAGGAVLPLVVDGEEIGMLELDAPAPDCFDRDAMQLMQDLVRSLCFALEIIGKQEKLNYLANYDPLTDLPNRTLFLDRLTLAIDSARLTRSKLAIKVFDIERFKAVNDAYGQRAGDEVLQQVARRLRATVEDAQQVARVGSDSFAVLFHSIRDAEEVARRVAASGVRALEAPLSVAGQQLRLSARAGVAVFPYDGEDAVSLFRNAEAALKRARETGEKYLFYTPALNARVAEQLDLENRLREAVEKRQFVLHFQPKVDLASRSVQGLEALIRWDDPRTGLVPPGRFITALEETGLIHDVGRWALAEAVATYRRWRARGIAAPRIAVNVSALQLRDKSFVGEVRAALDGEAAEHCLLDLEITESLLMTDVEESMRKLREVRALGVGVSLDDFGTGHSSLGYLSRLPLDALKIDRVFVHSMVDKAEDMGIVSAILALARGLGLKVIAEGVETEEQADLLALLQCDEMQGYLISKPLPLDGIEPLLGQAR